MKVFWGILLAASLVANVLLLLVRDEAEVPAPAEHREAASARSSPAVRATGAAQTDLESLEDAALERRLADAEARLSELANPKQKFAHATRSLDVEARVTPYLDDVFAELKDLKYAVECRGRVCKIDAPFVRGEDWTWKLQTLWPRRALFGGMSFGPDGVFIELAPPELIPAAFLDGMLRAAWLRAHKPCGFATSPAGDLTLTLAYDAVTRRVTRNATGSLAQQPVGMCTSKALDEVIATTELPPEMTRSLRSEPLELTLPIPDED